LIEIGGRERETEGIEANSTKILDKRVKFRAGGSMDRCPLAGKLELG
jgi:hypothetical protein